MHRLICCFASLVCSANIKCALFKAFCAPLYAAHLWWSYRKSSMRRLTVADNDAMRLLLQVPRWHSASQLFVFYGVPACEALQLKLMYNVMYRLDEPENSIIVALTSLRKSCLQYSSRLRKHCRHSLFINYELIFV